MKLVSSDVSIEELGGAVYRARHDQEPLPPPPDPNRFNQQNLKLNFENFLPPADLTSISPNSSAMYLKFGIPTFVVV